MTRSAPLAFHTGWVNTRPLMEKALALITEGAFDPRRGGQLRSGRRSLE